MGEHASGPERGQATVELALMIPVVVVIVAALFEAVTIAVDHVRVWHAAREAARAAVVDADPAAARRAAGRSGVAPIEVAVEPGPAHRVIGRPLTASVAHRHHGRIPLVGELFERVVVRAQATMRIEQP